VSSLKSLLLAAVGMGAAAAATDGLWTPINDGLAASTVGIVMVVPDPNNPLAIYALTSGGAIYKTTDGTALWRQVSGLTLVNSLVIDPADSNTLYAATAHGIFKTTDGGANWGGANSGLDLNSLSLAGINIDPFDPSTIYVMGNAGTCCSVLKSTDGAATWSSVYTFTNPNFPGRLTIDPSTPSSLYLTMVGGAIFKSTDGGRELEPVQVPSHKYWIRS